MGLGKEDIEIQSTVALTDEERDAVYKRAIELGANIVLVRNDEIGWLGCEFRRRYAHFQERPFERIRRITGYLVGTIERFNDAKRHEEHDRVKHGLAKLEDSRVMKDGKTRLEIVTRG